MLHRHLIGSDIKHREKWLDKPITAKGDEKRKVKEVEKELAAHRVTSPVKTRRKSLINLFKEDECPLTVP